MSKWRRLRRLVPDEVLYDRRVAGEPLRAIAPDYGVAHTTLGDFFRRPEAVLGLEEARRRLEAERKARQAMVRSLEQDVRRRAREDKERDRQLEAWTLPSLQPYIDWPPSRRSSGADQPAAVQRQRLHGRGDRGLSRWCRAGDRRHRIAQPGKRVARHRCPDRKARAGERHQVPSNARPDDRRLRRLAPDSELIRRGAAASPLVHRCRLCRVSHDHSSLLQTSGGLEAAAPYAATERSPTGPKARVTAQPGYWKGVRG